MKAKQIILISLTAAFLLFSPTLKAQLKFTDPPKRKGKKAKVHILPKSLLAMGYDFAYFSFYHGELTVPEGEVNEADPASKTWKQSVFPFYLSKQEVSNFEYRKFLSSLSGGNVDAFPDSLLPDFSLQIPLEDGTSIPLKSYFESPSYWNYPVLGVSHAQANAYCAWLHDEFLDKVSIKELGRLGYLMGSVRLPSRNEWELAAQQDQPAFGLSGYPVCLDSLPADANGIRGLQNNAAEWINDIDFYGGKKPKLQTHNVAEGDSSRFLIRDRPEHDPANWTFFSMGTSFQDPPASLPAGAERKHPGGGRAPYLGFRVAFSPLTGGPMYEY